MKIVLAKKADSFYTFLKQKWLNGLLINMFCVLQRQPSHVGMWLFLFSMKDCITQSDQGANEYSNQKISRE